MSNEIRLLAALYEANRRLKLESPSMPISVAVTFLAVAMWGRHEQWDDEPMTLGELAGRLDLPATTISQHMRYLGSGYRSREDGLNVVTTIENRFNRRKKVFFLTPLGRAVAYDLTARMEIARSRAE